MSKFTNELRNLVASNRLDEMIRQLMKSLVECEREVGMGNQAVKEIRNKAIQYSARLNDIKTREANQTVSHTEAQTSHSRILTALLNLIDDFYKYPDYLGYLEDVEEDQAWEEAKKLNKIEAYQQFFEKYPDGKYTDETKAIIAKIREIESAADAEIQQTAQQERDRREREEDRKRRDAIRVDQEHIKLAEEAKRLAEDRDRIEAEQNERQLLAEEQREEQRRVAKQQALRKAELKAQMKVDKKNFFVPDDEVTGSPGSVVVPKREKGLRAWFTRHSVAFCNVFIAFFFGLFLLTLIPYLPYFRTFLELAIIIFSILVSIPLVFSRKGGSVITLTGLLGISYIPFISMLVDTFDYRPWASQHNGIKEFYLCLGAFLLIVVVLGIIARKKAQKELAGIT